MRAAGPPGREDDGVSKADEAGDTAGADKPISGDSTADEIATTVERVWRDEAAGMLGVLARRLGDLDVAEEALQDAVADALPRWAADGVPANPAGWLVTTAWRKAIDRHRREVNGRAKEAALASDPTQGQRTSEPPRLPGELDDPAWPPSADDRLALIFACCHPALPEASRVALTLHAVAGLPAETVAAAFLLPRATAAQRLVRAKRHLRDHRVRVETPPPDEYRARLPSVLSVIYLIYNEGYLATSDGSAERRELAREGLDLARQVATLMPGEPEAAGLAALLELHESRATARFDAAGRMVLLEDQDRSVWNRPLIASALRRLRRVAALGRPGPYQVEAAIAAQHALAPSWERTDWPLVRRLYDLLAGVRPTPVVLLGRAVATSFTAGPEVALAEVGELAGRLDGYRLWHATRADLLRRLGRPEEAAEATRRALALATNPAERDLLTRRLNALTER
jgi:predicted RNA polymerase sigma factor